VHEKPIDEHGILTARLAWMVGHQS
jgi:hypothetical protein